ncbi:hypothetical protein [Sabulicella glaciei]|uniref:DUF2568 domain-containing protein n=1 Tax=Sabulicella glaciei TaxID=2984948 RepID=A0ABT3NX45_9PROT|nr:hypothetical protein [Roseococcus sp. MDT2-1-1]MCW8086741.1 hypothetical protein [Roseococcus sp. MDT2-1-1]
MTTPPSAAWRWLRRALLLTAVLEASGAAVLVWWGLMEDRSWQIARPLGQIAAAFLAACIVPAFVMAWTGRSLALAALLLALPAGLALWGRFG